MKKVVVELMVSGNDAKLAEETVKRAIDSLLKPKQILAYRILENN